MESVMNKKLQLKERSFAPSCQSYAVKLLSVSLLLSLQAVYAVDIVPAQPGATNNYQLIDVYTLPGGVQRVSSLNPAGVEALIRGGTDTFLATLQAEFPAWTFTAADADLEGDITILNYYACGPATTDCATEQGIPSTVNGSFIDVTYTPAGSDPTAAANDLHWIQRIYSNHAAGAGGGHGINVDKIDNDNSVNDPVLGLCANNPYYDCGYFAGETFFVDRPHRSGDPENDHVWGAELYLVEQTAANTVTIYNGIKWGWLNTSSDVRSLVAPPSTIIFENPLPASGAVTTGIGTGSISWGRATSSSFPSSLSITPSSFDVTPLIGEPFVFGTISYANGTIESGTGLTSINLKVQSSIDVADLGLTGLSVEDIRVTSMINTPNTCNADVAGDCTHAESRESADYVSIPPASDLTVVPSTYPSFAELGNNFHVFEEGSATATLVGRITEAKITDASDGLPVDGLTPPLSGAIKGNSATRKMVIEFLGFGKVLEGDGFITRGVPGPSLDDIVDPADPGGILTGGGTVAIGFGTNDGLTRQSIVTLDTLSQFLFRSEGYVIELSAGRNDSSEKRLRVVQSFLVSHGISKDRVVVNTKSTKRPAKYEKKESERSKAESDVFIRLLKKQSKK